MDFLTVPQMVLKHWPPTPDPILQNLVTPTTVHQPACVTVTLCDRFPEVPAFPLESRIGDLRSWSFLCLGAFW